MDIYVTRFNDLTYKENKNWLLNHNEEGCIYGSPVKISTKILPNTYIIVLEMNNSTNKIEGIGIIKNKLACDKKYKIYSDNNYNRFIYKSKLHISRDSFTSLENNIIIQSLYLSLIILVCYVSGERMAFATYAMGIFFLFIFLEGYRKSIFFSILLGLFVLFTIIQLHP